MERKFLKKENLHGLIDAIARRYRLVYIRKGVDGKLHLDSYSGGSVKPVIGEARPFEPLKNFFFRAREKVVDDYQNSQKVGEPKDRPVCILGVKNCDLKGFDILDHVFTQGDFEDPFYIRNRRRNLIIASDCTQPLDTCFCHALGHEHYPEKNYDILISEIGGGYLIEAGTERGSGFLNDCGAAFEPAAKRHLEERDRARRRAGERVEENIRERAIPSYKDYDGIIKENLDSEIWKRESETCVECGSCNFACPTCHCFYLVDTARGSDNELRYKVWDSCMYKSFARVAGGANPRAHLSQRLRNRFEKKFDFFPEVSGQYACTGCGRCISGCPAKIDIRRILKDLVAEKRRKRDEG